ncbi:hypothetical protein M5E87_26665 [Flavonifractor plautii]|nr:hypothetical protein M5E87_26665 [Flavonifractor plautii]
MAYLMSFPLTYVVALVVAFVTFAIGMPLTIALCRKPPRCLPSLIKQRSGRTSFGCAWIHFKEVHYVSSLYAKSPENQGYIKNMEVVGFCDLNGVNAFQMALHKTDDGRYYMYCGSFRGPGWNVVDVTDPTQPKVVNWLEACDPKEYPATNTPKIQVADGLMIGATGGGVSFLHGCKPGDKSLGSLQIFDIKTDPVHPKLLGKWETGVENGMGVHRFFYNGGRYVHLSADCPGYTGNIYRILDIIDPTHRWRWAAGGCPVSSPTA